jgi:hypothetical protein
MARAFWTKAASFVHFLKEKGRECSMYSAGRTFRDRARQSLEADCDAAHPARRVLKRYYVGRPRTSREIDFVLQVLELPCTGPARREASRIRPLGKGPSVHGL